MENVRTVHGGFSISRRNVNGMLTEAIWLLAAAGKRQDSRNGPVLVMPAPTTLTYQRPRERVLFNAQRNANPFFHLMESLWMLAGRNDVAFVAQFVKRMEEFSDNGTTQHGAYGHRWRVHFDFDQLDELINHLISKPDTRRATLAMWDPRWDLKPRIIGGINGKDVPCNTHIYFLRDQDSGELDMTVCNRSNDVVWGACGANAVHLSVLQEYVASAINAPMGGYHQFTNNLHLYTERFDLEMLKSRYETDDRYYSNYVYPYHIMSVERAEWDNDLRLFMSDPLGDTNYRDPFFSDVAAPVFASWHQHKRGNTKDAITIADSIAAIDWKIACGEWLLRAASAKKEAA